MNFDRFFKIISYAVVFCGFLTLLVSGGIETISVLLFVSVLITAWFLENSRWQISERLGTIAVFVVVPLFYLGRYKIIGIGGMNAAEIAGMLAKMILVLAAIKLLQRKSDRDWLFLYLMAFFEVLLAAGISISPFYLASLILYLLVTICAIVAFEIRKTSRSINQSKTVKKEAEDRFHNLPKIPIARVSTTAFTLLISIIIFAAPLFFALPRVGGAGVGGGGNGGSGLTGFSSSVNLGEIGRLKQSDQVVMRARIESPIENSNSKIPNSLKWRGVALDEFDNKLWKKSGNELFDADNKGERGNFRFGYAADQDSLTIQTIYLEPVSTPILFALSRPISIQANVLNIRKDSEGALNVQRENSERLSYKVYSDTSQPSVAELRADNKLYQTDEKKYLQLPEKFDERIAQLAAQITEKYTNRYDKAKAVEYYLQNNLGYTLDLKATGDQPLADFLFRVREGHCEYFASAMAIMLRTQGIATRIVNGFQQGEYNETAGVFIIKDKDAHSWVEVYFPGEKSWITFDPTPFAGQIDGANSTGIAGTFNKYIEALETFWIQYFVSYDNQEQRSLMRSFKNNFADYQSKTSVWLNEMQNRLSNWWQEARGDKGLQSSLQAIAFGAGYLAAAVVGIVLFVWLYRRIKKLEIWQRIYAWLKRKNDATIIEFYERMQKVLAGKGFRRAAHQTPLEFAFALNMPEAVRITEKYNRVRFGEKNLSSDEAKEIENWLKRLEEKSI